MVAVHGFPLDWNHWQRLKELGVRKPRTGLSWADSYRPNADAWFDRQMRALEDFELTDDALRLLACHARVRGRGPEAA